MPELTTEQHNIIEELASEFHLVMVDILPDGSAELTPANFCTACGGDGFNDETFDDCAVCKGRGGIPVTHPPRIIGRDGVEVPA
jgi:hypothetical protein